MADISRGLQQTSIASDKTNLYDLQSRMVQSMQQQYNGTIQSQQIPPAGRGNVITVNAVHIPYIDYLMFSRGDNYTLF